MRPILFAAVAAGILLFTDRPASAQTNPAIEEFTRRVDAYYAIHKQAERNLPRQRSFMDASEAQAALDRMAEAMRFLRHDAREGDVFSETVAPALREVVMATLRDKGYDPLILLDEMEANISSENPRLEVNERFPWGAGNMMLPSLIEALPQVPVELQYRLVGTDLVLIDLHANLVVDVLRDALPVTTFVR